MHPKIFFLMHQARMGHSLPALTEAAAAAASSRDNYGCKILVIAAGSSLGSDSPP